MKDLEYKICPENHHVSYTRDSFAKDFSDGDIDIYGVPMYEIGLYCLRCQRPYGISKLKEPTSNDLSLSTKI